MQHEHTLYLGLGSNLGPRDQLLRRALSLVGQRVGRLEAVSPFEETLPVGFVSANRFLNAVARVSTSLSPEACLRETLAIERQLGRREKSHDGQYHDRPIDIDLLLYDQLQLDETYTIDGRAHRLLIPHPRIAERPFVSRPLARLIENDTNPHL